MNKNKVSKISSIYGIIIVMILWYILNIFFNSKIIPSPHETIKTFIKLLGDDLLLHLLYSGYRIIIALIIAIIIGVPLGLIGGVEARLDKVFTPIAYILYPLPKVAFLPIFMLLFGLGDKAKIYLLVSIIIFQVQLATRDGVQQIPKEMWISIKTLGIKGINVYRYLVIPAVLPKLFSALRITIGISISALFLSENFATTYGIGYFIMNSWIMVDYNRMFAGILALSIFGMILFKIIDILENYFCRWQG